MAAAVGRSSGVSCSLPSPRRRDPQLLVLWWYGGGVMVVESWRISDGFLVNFWEDFWEDFCRVSAATLRYSSLPPAAALRCRCIILAAGFLERPGVVGWMAGWTFVFWISVLRWADIGLSRDVWWGV